MDLATSHFSKKFNLIFKDSNISKKVLFLSKLSSFQQLVFRTLNVYYFWFYFFMKMFSKGF